MVYIQDMHRVYTGHLQGIHRADRRRIPARYPHGVPERNDDDDEGAERSGARPHKY